MGKKSKDDIERKFIRKVMRFFRKDISDEELCLKEQQNVITFFKQYFNEQIKEPQQTLQTTIISFFSIFLLGSIIFLIILFTAYFEQLWILVLSIPFFIALFMVEKKEYLYYNDEKIVIAISTDIKKQNYNHQIIYYSEIQKVLTKQTSFRQGSIIRFKLFLKNGRNVIIEVTPNPPYKQVFAMNFRRILLNKTTFYDSDFKSKW